MTSFNAGAMILSLGCLGTKGDVPVFHSQKMQGNAVFPDATAMEMRLDRTD